MSENIHKVTVQIKASKGTFPGEVAEGWYVVFENNVILTDQDGKPIAGVPKHHLTPDGDARLIAPASVAGFNRPIVYPKLKY